MLNTLVGALVTHRYVWADTAYTHREVQSPRYQPAVWFGLVSMPGRMWGCTVMLESGAVYRALPPMAITFSPAPVDDDDWDMWPKRSQEWDCYGTGFAVVEYPYLTGLRCLAKADTIVRPGEHLFSVAPVGDGFSAVPEQAKEFHFIELDNHRLTIQPTNRLVYEETSFTAKPMAFPSGLQRQTDVYSCE